MEARRLLHSVSMRWLLVGIAVWALCASGADKKKKSEVEVLQLKAVHDGADVTVDGRVRSTAEKPIQNLVLEFEFLASGKQVVTTRRIAIDEPTLDKGDEAAFHAATTYPTNAIQVRVRAYISGDISSGLEATVANPGPFPIEN
jgi:hypothetical protein